MLVNSASADADRRARRRPGHDPGRTWCIAAARYSVSENSKPLKSPIANLQVFSERLPKYRQNRQYHRGLRSDQRWDVKQRLQKLNLRPARAAKVDPVNKTVRDECHSGNHHSCSAERNNCDCLQERGLSGICNLTSRPTPLEIATGQIDKSTETNDVATRRCVRRTSDGPDFEFR